ncbi:MAG: C1 family peptidase [Bacteroidales bacterium]|nr:C1 family peptidase [Bacteroidales bacterium]
MRAIKLILLSAALCGSMGAMKADVVTPESTGFKFTDTKVVKTTSIKDQNQTGTCWCFSVVAFMENEILRTSGKEVDLSEMFVVRSLYPEKAQKYMRMEGEMRFNLGGGVMDVIYAWDKYGIVPESVYSGLNYGEEKHDHLELIAGMKGFMKGIVAKPSKRYSTAWLRGLNGILDAYLGKVPETFEVDGVEYTPKTYAASFGLNAADYKAFSSFTHHPFYQDFIIEIPDNWLWSRLMNVPLNELEQIVDHAIANGYSVAWAADMSEKTWQWDNGYAIMPVLKTEADMSAKDKQRWKKLPNKDREKERYEFDGPQPEMVVTQEVRQQMFDSFETVDDHLMVIVGLAKDQKGNKYYKVKNSWDTNQIYDGYIYVSSAYFRAKTIDIMLHKDGVPADVLSKIGK